MASSTNPGGVSEERILEVKKQSTESFPFRIGYVTDVEGNLDYFHSFVSHSTILRCDTSSTSTHNIQLTLSPNAHFVYGGDVVDKGVGDIRLTRALVSLKQKYPDRVHLLVGNRDLNKLRFHAELSKADVEGRALEDIPGPHWDPEAPTLEEYLEGVVEEKKREKEKGSEDVTKYDVNTRVERLKYMLKHTLGCPDTFEFRRCELGILRDEQRRCGHGDDTHQEEISDEEVLQSFLQEITPPHGSLYQYISLSQAVIRIGNTLFAHGAIDSSTLLYLPTFDTKFENPPSRPAPRMICTNLNEWISGMNRYLQVGLEDFVTRPDWNEQRTSRGGESLMALQNRPAMWGRSIVSNCYGDGGCITTDYATEEREDPKRRELEETDPLVFEKVCSDPMDEQVASILKKEGVRRVVVGHKPTGDSPAVLSGAYTGVEVVSADISYSDVKALDNRGAAIAVVEIVGESEDDNCLILGGQLKDGVGYWNTFNRLYGLNEMDDMVGDANLGRRLEGGWWVKVSIPPFYRLCRGRGRKVEYRTVHKSQLGEFL